MKHLDQWILERFKGRLLLAAILIPLIWLFMILTGRGQSGQIARATIKSEDQLIEQYDRFREQTDFGFYSTLRGSRTDGLGISVLVSGAGASPRGAAVATVGVILFGERLAGREGDMITLLVDGERRELRASYYQGKEASLRYFQLAGLWTRAEIVKLAEAGSIEGRLGEWTEFSLGERQRHLLRALAERMGQ